MVMSLGRHSTYPQAELVGEDVERVLLQQRADKLVYKAQLLTGAQLQNVGQRPGPLGARALGEEELECRDVLVVLGIAVVPAGPPQCWAGRCGRGRRGWGRPGELDRKSVV